MTDINKMKNICSFYASEWHLVTMLLPNINKRINEGIKITTILEKNLDENMKKILEKLNIENKEKILNIDWKKENLNKESIKEKIEKNNCIIIYGTEEYIEKVHTMIDEYEELQKEITIIDCYSIEECKDDIEEILKEHEIVLNTSGERKKEEYITMIKM